MPNQNQPDHHRHGGRDRGGMTATADQIWHKFLTEGNVEMKRWRHLYGLLPANPRCVLCHMPFSGIGGALLRRLQGNRRSPKNPRFCTGCHAFTTCNPGGAEVELSMLFADVRGSTSLAERMEPMEFSLLMNRFYEAVINVLTQANAFVDRLVGDEVVGLFIPGYAGSEHARRAVEAGQNLLRATGHAEPEGPWVPVGVGIHTGAAWVGSIPGTSDTADFTALGDNMNIAARLASQAGMGEVLVSEAACSAAQIRTQGLERRLLELKGKSERVPVMVMHAR
jgi:adenylate cyclase